MGWSRRCINSIKIFIFKTYEAFDKDTNESIRKSDTISNLQRDPKKTKLVLEQYDSDNDEVNLKKRYLDFFFNYFWKSI